MDVYYSVSVVNVFLWRWQAINILLLKFLLRHVEINVRANIYIAPLVRINI